MPEITVSPQTSTRTNSYDDYMEDTITQTQGNIYSIMDRRRPLDRAVSGIIAHLS